MKKAIILDVDGTLWDSTERIAESYNATLLRLGIKHKRITRDMVCGFMGFVTEDIAKILFPEYTFDERMELIKYVWMQNVIT